MSVLQLAGAFDVTVNGPPVLCQGGSVTACASSSLLVALSWISCMLRTSAFPTNPKRELILRTVLLYSFSLLTTTITHMNTVPDVWTSSIRAVPWFVGPPSSLECPPSYDEKARRFEALINDSRASIHYSTPIFERHTKALPPSPLEPPKFPMSPVSPRWQNRKGSAGSLESAGVEYNRRMTWTNRMSGALSHRMSMESMRPGWAKRLSARRGVDLPFNMNLPRFAVKTPPPVRPLRPFKLKSHWSQSTSSPPPVPSRPPKARVAGTSAGPLDTSLSPTSTFYIDLERDAVVPVDPVTRPVSYGMFPEDVMDPDQPITRVQRSEWVSARSTPTLR